VLWIRGDPLLFLGAPFFFYKNQNAAYQTLLTGWILAWWALRCARRPLSSPLSGLLLFGVAELGLASIRSRAGMLFAVLVGAAWLFYQRRVLMRWWRSHRVQAPMAVLVLVVAAGTALWTAGGAATIRRFGEEGDLVRVGVHGGKFRFLQHQIALEMFKDRPFYGWGAASFLYNYARYEGRVPEMASNRPNYSYHLLTPHADGDWYEFLAEFGVVGTSLFALAWLPHLVFWVRRRIWGESAVFMPALGAVLVLGHGFIDMVFRNVGLLFVLAITVALVTKSRLLVRRGESPAG
jgi:O-antigen ligase